MLSNAGRRWTGLFCGHDQQTIELAKAHGWYMTRQFENEANPDIHSRTTAREILDDFFGQRWTIG